MTKTAVKGLAEFTSIRYLDPEAVEFSKTPGGFLSLKIHPDEFYPRINVYRAFPFTHPKEFITLREPETKDIGVKRDEIGMIRNLEAFPAEVVKLVEDQLERRYFSPVIHKINKIKEEFGYIYWEVDTDAGFRNFTVHGGHNIIPLTEDKSRILVIDTDGNRYEIEDYTALDDKNSKKLEMFI